MKSKFTKGLIISAVMCFTQGCSARSFVPIDQNTLRLEESSPPGLHLSTSAYLDEGNLVIVGRLQRGPLDRRGIPGHIDINVVGPNGEELSSVVAQFRKLPSWRRGPNPVAFRAEFPGEPPVGSIIKVFYDAQSHESTKKGQFEK